MKPTHERIYAVLSDHQWHYLEDIAAHLGHHITGASARMREFRRAHPELPVEIKYGAGEMAQYRLGGAPCTP